MHAAVGKGAPEALRALGRWVHPGTPFAARSDEESSLYVRVGILTSLAVATGLGLTFTATVLFAMGIDVHSPINPIEDTRAIIVGALLILFSVLAPQASFRTRQAAWTRMIFNDTRPIVPSWQRSTVQFDALLVGAILAGLFFPASITVAAFGWSLLLKVIVSTRRSLPYDPNARFEAVAVAWVSGMTALVGYVVIAILGTPLTMNGSPLPIVIAVLVAIYAGLGFEALQRWATLASERWAFVRDALDLQRLLVAGVIATVTWSTAMAGDIIGTSVETGGDLLGSAVGIAVLIGSWLALWLLSVLAWRRDAEHVLAAWRKQQAEVLRRIAEGSLSSDLAARAALPTATRVAVAIFGASQARAAVSLPDGTRRSSMATADLSRNGLPAELVNIEYAPQQRIPLGSPDGLGTTGSVLVVNWLTVGGIVLRSKSIVAEFAELASIGMLSPVVSQDYLSPRRAFDTMFHADHRWPSLAAYDEAVSRLAQQADHAPQSTSLILGVLEIDDFGALAGGKFEHTAVAQVVRLTLGNDDFTGREMFLAYEEPGRLWVALLGGPVIRQGIGQLTALQQRINDHGSVTSRRVDIDVTVSVSLGYATYQVDAVSTADLRGLALQRLAADQHTRQALFGETLSAWDFTPEDITGSSTAPLTTNDLLASLRDHRPTPGAFTEHLSPVHSPGNDTPVALVLHLGWPDAPGDLDLSHPMRFLDLAERQLDLAEEYLTGTIEAMKRLIAATPNSTIPIIAYAPARLLHPDSGAAAIPNIAGRLLDRIEASRAVFVFRSLPVGSGQAASLLVDRGIGIALEGTAAGDLDPHDLSGWPRWGLILPVIDGVVTGLDGLSVNQMSTALGSRGTHVIAEITPTTDQRRLANQGIELVVTQWDEHSQAAPSDLIARIEG